jgi:carbonic anhydrase
VRSLWSRGLLGIFLGVGLLGSAYAWGAAHWSYEGADGPANWASLDPAFSQCADSGRQSPIDVGHAASAQLAPLRFHLVRGHVSVQNNGHTIVAFANAKDTTATNRNDTLVLGGVTYSLLQMHFHAPSEHEVNGRSYPAEAHFVFQAPSGSLAVVGVFLQQGKRANRAWRPFVKALGTTEGKPAAASLSWSAMLPKGRTTVRYPGSLTTPPCSEGVKWNVETQPVTVSRAQLRAFTAAYDHNNRPLQTVGSRRVVTDA